MPLSNNGGGGSSFRRKSIRSPAPPTPSPNLPAFMPPSHFAKAGGYVFKDGKLSRQGSEEKGIGYTNSKGPVESLAAAVKREYEDKNKDSEDREREDRRAKRASQMSSDIPNLEAQLLPSLRDTIDRMTRQPSLNRQSSIASSISETARSRRVSNVPPTPTPNADNLTLDADVSSSPAVRTPKINRASKLSPMPTQTPTHDENVPPPPSAKVPTPSKSPLKSALRTSTPKMKQPKPAGDPPPTPSTSPGTSSRLKSVRSILSRKASVVNSSFEAKTSRPSRTRSLTDPGSASVPPSHPPPLTPQLPTHMKPYASQIPRARAFLSDASSTSDFEGHFERRNRRTLTVMNAEIVPSSSSSDSDRQFRIPSTLTPTRDGFRRGLGPGAGKQECKNQGLGLGIMHMPADGHGHNGVRVYTGRDSEEESIYDDENSIHQAPIGLQHRTTESFSSETSASESTTTTSSSSAVEGGGEVEAEYDSGVDESRQFEKERDKRKSALLDIITDLRFDHGHDNDGEMTDSEYHGVPGVALSESKDADVAYTTRVGRGHGHGTEEPVVSGDEDEMTDVASAYSDEDTGGDVGAGVDGTDRPGWLTPMRSAPAPPTPRVVVSSNSWSRLGQADNTEGHQETRPSGSYSPSLRMQSSSDAQQPHGEPPSTPRPGLVSGRRERVRSRSNSTVWASLSNNEQVPNGSTEGTVDVAVSEFGCDDDGSGREPRILSRKGVDDSLNWRRELSVERGGHGQRRYSRSPTPQLGPGTDTERQQHGRRLSPKPSPSPSMNTSGPGLGERRSRTYSSSSHRTVREDSYYAAKAKQEEYEHELDAVTLAKDARVAAAKERQRFGIPPSESDVDADGVEKVEIQAVGSGGSLASIISAGSVYSDDGVFGRTDKEEEFSRGAEDLFRKISDASASTSSTSASGVVVGDVESPVVRRTWRGSGGVRMRMSRTMEEEIMQVNGHSHDQRRDKDDLLSGEKDAETQSDAQLPQPSSMPHPHTLSDRVDPIKTRRETVLQQLLSSEVAFLDVLDALRKMYILPLRVSGERRWVSGVPGEIGMLLDWVEDVEVLHRSAFAPFLPCDANGETEGLVERLRTDLVPRLGETHTGLVVKLGGESGVGVVKGLIEDGSEFEEFVRLQERTGAGKGKERTLTLLEMLVKPLERLGEYEDVFAQLLDATFKSQRDYLSTFALKHQFGLVMKILEEVTRREEAYERVKELMVRVDLGEADLGELVRRDRGLLWTGMATAERVDLKDAACDVETELDSKQRTRAGTSRLLVDDINDQDDRQDDERLRRRSTYVKASHTSRSRISPSSRSNSALLSRVSPPTSKDNTEERVQVFVFEDCLVLAACNVTVVDNGEESWSALGDGSGLSRVLSVEEGATSIVVDLLPVGFKLNEPTVTNSLSNLTICTVRLSPSPSSITHDMLAALTSSQQSTLCTITAPSTSASSNVLLPALNSDRRHKRNDGTFLIPVDNADVGDFPMPKSPSCQVEEFAQTNGSSAMFQKRIEREQRGWWAARYQKLLESMT